MVTEAVLVDSPSGYATRSGAQRALAVGFVAATVTLIGGIGVGSTYLLLLGLTLPGLVLHDYFKVLILAGDSPHVAVAQEAAWTSLTVVGILVGVLFSGSPLLMFAVWAASGALVGCCTAVVRRCRLLPAWGLPRGENRLTMAFGVQFLVTSGSAQLALAAMAATAGAGVVGALGAARLVIGPVALLVSAGALLAIPYLARRQALPPRERIRYSLMIAIIFCGSIAPIAVLCNFLSDSWGIALLGTNWESARPLVPLLAIESLLTVMSLIAFAGHRVERAGSRTLVIGFLIGIVRVLALSATGHTFGARGAAYVLVLLASLSVIVWWTSYVLLVRRQPTGVT